MTRHCIRGLVAGAALALSALPAAHAQEFKVTLNAPYDGSNAAFFLAEEKGYYAAEGLKLTMDPSGGSGEVATRVGSGTYDFGFGDINVLMEFNAKNPDNAGKAVYMLYYRSPLSVGSLAKGAINKPSDLDGKKLGGALTDGAYKLFPAYASLAKVDANSVKWSFGDLRIRETMLLKGDVDGILGFDSTMYFNLLRQGIASSDIKFLYYSDVGLNIYGNAIVASKKAIESNPKAVKGFVAATAKGWRDAIANPSEAIAALKKKSPLIDEKLELAKLEWLIKNQLVTDESKRDGLGGVDEKRLASSLETVSKAFGLPKTVTPAEVWTAEFLPPADVRKLPK
ncbi:MAG TPA: ABC transporter substrate-binding protein [Lacipirellulaceae bacterium]|jgi:NitT/TauT family transport system substrate-binding protein|nr:ABC transporter substrate-binding protein [Lacipirellulaceae bacterium]